MATHSCGIQNPSVKGSRCKKGITENAEFCEISSSNRCVFAENPRKINPKTGKPEKYTLCDVQKTLAERNQQPVPVLCDDDSDDDMSDDATAAAAAVDTKSKQPDDLTEIMSQLKIHDKLPPVKMYDISEFSEVLSLGVSGTYGSAFSAKHIATGQKVTLKKYKSYYNSVDIPSDVILEITLLAHLNRFPETKTVKYYGLCRNSRDMNDLYLVLEYLPADFHHAVVKKDKKLGPRQIKILFYQILKAFDAIHSLGIIHNDIKPPNVMIMAGGDIRIIDFGIAEYHGLGVLKYTAHHYLATQEMKAPDDPTDSYSYSNGTRKHLAENVRKSYKSDAYMIGIFITTICHRNLFNYHAYNGDLYVDGETTGMTLDNSLKLDPNKVGPDGYDLLVHLLEPVASKRYSCRQALAHPYFSDVDDTAKIDMGLIMAGGTIGSNINNMVSYSKEDYIEKRFELSYMEDIHRNYINDVIFHPVEKRGSDLTTNNRLLSYNWIIEVFTKGIFRMGHDNVSVIGSIDSIINGFNLLDRFGSIRDIARTQIQKINVVCISTYENVVNNSYADLKIWQRLSANTFTVSDAARTNMDIIAALDAKIPFKPIWVHIEYIYLKIKYETEHQIQLALGDGILVDLDPILELLKRNVVSVILLYYSFACDSSRIPNYTIWNVTQYAYIVALSKLLSIDKNTLVSKPFVDCLSINPEIFSKMNTYYVYLKDLLTRLDKLSKYLEL